MGNANEIFSRFIGKKVLVTGNTGFKGAWLSTWLHQLGAEVHGLSLNVPTEPSLFVAVGGEASQATSWVDVCDSNKVQEILEAERPDFIFHLAAQPIVGVSFNDPLETWRTNTLGSASLLDAIRRSSLSDVSVVMITSDKVYRNHEWHWGYRETDELGGYDPYSASKAGAEMVIRSYVNSGLFEKKNIKVVSVRAGNVIGGGDWAPGRIVPDAVRAWAACKPLFLRSPSATRPWQHVLEPLGGYLLTAAAMDKNLIVSGESFNFGPRENSSRTVGDVVAGLGSRLGGSPPLKIEYEQSSLQESGLLRLSSEKAEQVLSWQPVLDFEGNLDWTADWYAQNETSSGTDARRFTLDQIKAYQDLLNATPDWGRP
jgi:CDP-glucose 4,6-dehydratase